jgi:hypothetical protein
MIREIRERIREAVSHLYGLDDQLAELAERLILPPDAEEMWESRIPTSFPTNLYAALEAVRSECLQDAAATLLKAVRQTDASLRREWLAREREWCTHKLRAAAANHRDEVPS